MSELLFVCITQMKISTNEKKKHKEGRNNMLMIQEKCLLFSFASPLFFKISEMVTTVVIAAHTQTYFKHAETKGD